MPNGGLIAIKTGAERLYLFKINHVFLKAGGPVKEEEQAEPEPPEPFEWIED